MSIVEVPVRVGFSTLGCPEWTLEHACEQARAMGFDGIELRVLDGAVVDARKRARVRDTLSASGLAVSALGSSVRLVEGDPGAVVDDLRAHVALAADWHIPAVRVFGGRFPPAVDAAAAVKRAVDVVADVLPDAVRSEVRIALETHDDFDSARSVVAVLDAVAHPAFGAIWDTQHTWRAGESPQESWSILGPYVYEIQVKDGRPTADGGWRQELLGAGVIPVDECISLARGDGFAGWLVVEWEKHWQPELAEPEVSFPAHRAALADLLT